MDKSKMITNRKGISYYRVGKSYFKNSGWREVEISFAEFKKAIAEYLEEEGII